MYLQLRAGRSIASIRRPLKPVGQIRRLCEIAIIDDDEFRPLEALRSHGFQLKELGDIRDIAAVAEYPIVCCDVMNVGSHFGSPLEGAHVVAEIKRRYPTKYVIVYSGGSFPAEYQPALQQGDKFLKRGEPIDDWVQSIDDAIRIAVDPVEQWKRARKWLIEQDVDTLSIHRIERAFVRSVEKGNPLTLRRALDRAQRVEETGKLVEAVAEGLLVAVHLSTLAYAG